ncbi:malate dehydrogenase [Colletotrichum abscissum]|nr:malate dehydrogenase [Colletotrichum tamarilloi]XP_060397968.1 malate dehydrogenase [Colletotrichum abscissum]KAI3543921.1 malate dehydrogenase [Colletotrichum filicis]KAK1469536.1 malate dehydrogenase [Colletotrichum melonis]KAK1717223.1 malate dehydrogenase [Colletotrichum lupini]KAI3535052.1 malate dehydrogenase [Colletotrichum abscissum]KAK1495592.1 malate dehydrogenase [Colletotrichum abscissum]
MRCSTLLVPALASLALAAPTYPTLNLQAALPGSIEQISEYFNMLATKVQATKYLSTAPVCDLSTAKLPEAATQTLGKPRDGLTLMHIAIGRGTQNYTCDTSNSTAVPVATGAVATLFNASCVGSLYPDLLDKLPVVAMDFNLTEEETNRRLGPSNLAISGHHLFTGKGVPLFMLENDGASVGDSYCAKNASMPAPLTAQSGQHGEAAVPWLRLRTVEPSTGDVQEVYRIHTVGGSAPASCQGQAANIEVQYATQYWFFSGPAQ